MYGFGNFDPNKPNLKSDFEKTAHGYVNGKYLYNKRREASNGKPVIKLSREYKHLFFNYLGYKDVHEFIDRASITEEQKNKQLELLNQKSNTRDYYYVCYYYGEDSRMNKGKIIIYNDWKKVEMIYVYENEKGDKGIYTFYGAINQSEDFVYFDTKYFSGNKKSEGAKFIFFIGKSSAHERHYLIGTYSGFDKYDRAIAGKMILKKFNTKMEMEEEISTNVFSPIICQELNKNRLVIESSIRKNPLLFSKKSPYAQVLATSSGNYIFDFIIHKKNYQLKLKLEKYHYNIVSLTEAIIIEDDFIKVINKGQIINLDFFISGMFQLQKVSIYIKAIEITNNKKGTQGSFNGIDINNNIVSGKVTINSLI